jgi:hypothetical protein
MMPGTADLPSDTDAVAERSAIVGALAANSAGSVLASDHYDRFAVDMADRGDIILEFLDGESLSGEVRSCDFYLFCH